MAPPLSHSYLELPIWSIVYIYNSDSKLTWDLQLGFKITEVIGWLNSDEQISFKYFFPKDAFF